MYKKGFLLAALFILALATNSAEAQDSLSISHLSTVEVNWENMNDVAVYNQYGFVATAESGLKILDFSSTDEIETIATIEGDITEVELSADGQTVLVSDWSEGRLKAYSISDPSNPVFLDQLMINGGDQVVWMKLTGDTLVSLNRIGQVRWTDVSDFNNITGISVLPLSCGGQDATYSDGKMVIYGGSSDQFTLIDCSDINNPEVISTIDLNINYYDVDVELLGSNLILANKYHNGSYVSELVIYDLTNPENLDTLSVFPIYGSPSDMKLQGSTLFISECEGGLDIIDITDLESPQRINRITDNYSYLLDIDGNSAISCQTFGGLDRIDFEDLINPEITHSKEIAGTVTDVCIVGDYAYIADMDGGVIVYNISDAANPQLVSRYNPAYFYCYRIAEFGDYLLLFTYSEIMIADISDPESLEVISTWEGIESTGFSDFIIVDDAIILLATEFMEDTEMIILERNGAGELIESYREEYAGTAMALAKNDNILYVLFEYSTSYSNIRIFDISIPAAPSLLGFTTFDHYGYDLAAGDDLLCVSQYHNGITIFDISNPTYLNEIATIESDDFRTRLELEGSNLYAYNDERAFRVYDLLTPSSPELLTEIESVYHIIYMDLEEDIIALAEYFYFTLLGIDETVNNNSPELKPETFNITRVYPTPFNSSLTVEVSVPSACTLNGRIYDVLGREVDSFTRKTNTAGLISYHWTPEIASGHYFMEISSNTGWKSVRRIVHVR